MPKKLKFLVIDDSKTIQFEFTGLLERAGHEAKALGTCDLALETVLQMQPDCILCDLMLPGMDAMELFTLIRAQKQLKQPTFIVISGKQFDYDRRRVLDLGVDFYLTKPVNPETFVDQIMNIIDGKMVIGFWGCRGTFPIPGKNTVRYGGNTNCLTVDVADKHHFIFDAGTGIKELSNHILQTNSLPYKAKIFISHPHYDHINGIPFFAPLYIKGNEFEFYGPDQEKLTLKKYLSMQMDSVYFPVRMTEFSSVVTFESLTEETFMVDDIAISTLLLNHPGRCLGYRVDYKGKIFCYITDNELYQLHDKERYNPEEVARLVKFINKADILVIDSTYTDEEYTTKANWGHSPLSSVIDVADQAKVKLLCLHHHSPDQFDDDIDKKLFTARAMLEEKQSATHCIAPREGQQLIL